MKENRKQDDTNALEEMYDNPSVQSQHKAAKRYRGKFIHRQNEGLQGLLCCLLVILIIVLFRDALNAISRNIKKTYGVVKDENAESVYNSFYESSFDKAKENSHTSNNISIRIEDIQEMASIEVLRASDVEYVVVNKEDNSENITSWIEVPGTGVFTVDLSCGEYIVDSQQRYVLIRVPRPILSNFKVDNEQINQLFWKDGPFNGSTKAGEDLMRNQISEGAMRLKEYMTSNRMIYENAVNSAKNMIESLVKQVNPEIPDLTVDVEFIEDV